MNALAERKNKPEVSGLDQIVFAETLLSMVDGEAGTLLLRGYDIESLSGHLSFAQAFYLLWFGVLPDDRQRRDLEKNLGEKRVQSFEQISFLNYTPANGMDFIRFALASFSFDDEDVWEQSLTLIAATAVAAAVWHRRCTGQDVIAPQATAGHGEDFLQMMFGKKPTAAAVIALESYLVTVMDHGMNASTFAARVVASTGSDLASSIVAGVGALKGPLHGGAPGPVLDMLAAVGQPEQARSWLEGELKAGRRIMGMGHRIYRVRDPRAAVLEKAIERLEQSGMQSPRLSLARAVEKAATALLQERYPDRPLKANVEFYTAVLLDAIGLPPDLFSPCFAVGRVVGWCAHVQEQRNYGRLVRPQSTFIGAILGKKKLLDEQGA